MATKKDIHYHNCSKVVDSYDFRITRSYQFEHDYLTLKKWFGDMHERGFQRILDFGCGTGNISFHLLSHSFQPVSLDTSVEMLKFVRGKIGKTKACCINGDGESLPFQEKSFDAVLCMGVLHHIADKEKAVREMIRIVRRGGKIYIAEPYQSKSRIMRFYQFVLCFLRSIKNILMGLKNLETEYPISREDIDQRICRPLKEAGKGISIYYYLYLPLVFRFLPDRLAKKIFCMLNPHVTASVENGLWGVREYHEPRVRGNICEVQIQC